ncbi:MAG: tetratricopeptide repeat protein [Chitinophagaceae bacterium]|nr:tetratricopeptide repeat protein [Rubrivivax sp.]
MTDFFSLRPAAAASTGALATAQQLHLSNRLAEAERAYRLLLQANPGDAAACHGLASLLAGQRRYEAAIPLFRRAVAALPGQAQWHVDLAQALRGVGLNEEAASHFDRAAALDPQDPHLQLLSRLQHATLYDEQGDDDRALAAFEEAVKHHPDAADAWAGLGMVQQHVVGPAAAESSFRRALQLDPERAEVIEKYGQVLQDLRQYEDAALVFERLMKRWPGRPMVAGRLLHCKMLTADWTALDILKARVENALSAGELSCEPFGLQGYCESPQLLMRGAQLNAAAYYPDRSAALPMAKVGRGEKLRVGYVSGEFRNQATSVLLTEVLETHDRTRFDIVAFDNGWDDRSALRQRIAAAMPIVPIRKLDNLAAARLVREHRIDVLINLNGYFGLSRTPLFAYRPAAIQVNYLGFPGTIGAPYIDYIVADPSVIPEELHHCYVEKVVTLPDSYQPNDSRRRVEPGVTRADAGLPEDSFVFCCMNNVYKIMPAMFDGWMRLLQRVPGSVLMLLSDVPEAHLNLRHEAQARGVDPERLLFARPWGNERHLARLRLCDLFLDTWPYNAHTTGSDALLAGLPVLTCMGQSFPSRVGASLVRAVGLPELVTRSFEAYEAMALKLATEAGLLSDIRARLASQLATAPLYDTPRYTRHLEAAFTQMVQRARAGLPPAAFKVEAIV